MNIPATIAANDDDLAEARKSGPGPAEFRLFEVERRLLEVGVALQDFDLLVARLGLEARLQLGDLLAAALATDHFRFLRQLRE